MTTASQARADQLNLWSRRIQLTILTVVLLAFTAIVIIPFAWMLVMSLRTTGEILNNPYGLPVEPHWQNYVKLMLDPSIRFYRYFINSVFMDRAGDCDRTGCLGPAST